MCIVKTRLITFLWEVKLLFDAPSCDVVKLITFLDILGHFVVKLITFLDILGHFLYFCMKVNVSGEVQCPLPRLFWCFCFHVLSFL